MRGESDYWNSAFVRKINSKNRKNKRSLVVNLTFSAEFRIEIKPSK